VSALVLVASCLVLGAALNHSSILPPDAPRALDALVLYVALPAVVLARRSGLHLDPQVWLPASMSWLQLGVATLAVTAAGRWYGWSRELRAALVLTAGFANTSFLGWPLVEAYLGPEALPTAIVADQLGSFVAVSTAGLTIAAWGAGEQASMAAVARNLARFPALPALGVGFALADVPLAAVDPALERLGGLLTPLALLSVGLRAGAGAGFGAPVVVGLATKLVLVPVALWAVYAAVGVAGGLPLQTTLLEASMPPMITAGILAADRGLAPPVARAMVAVGTPLGALTTLVWSSILSTP
jgi:predicted permease